MKKLFLSMISTFAVLAAAAQTSIQVQTHNVVDLNEQFNVTFVIEGENSASDFSWECPPDFDLVWGPQKSSSSSISIINGKRTSSRQSSYTYILMPKSVGEFELPPASAKVKGGEIVSRPFKVTVMKQDSQPQQPSAQGGGAVPSDPGASSGRGQGGRQSSGEQAAQSGEIFLNLSLDRTDVVVGQPINATLKIFQRANLSGFENASFPTFSGFWSQEVEAPSNIEFTRETYDGKIYDAAVLRRYVLIPQQTGRLTIEPAELVCLVNVRVQSRTGSIFDGFFDDYTTVRKKVSSRPVTVNVSPLPSGAPASFGGGVGKFSISARLSRDKIRAHEANSLIVTVSGRGNVSLLDAPKVTFPLDMEVYDVKVTDKSAKGSLSGSKEFEFPFIPRSPGEFTVEPVQYAYYDVDAGKYVVVSTAPLTFTVEKGADIPSAGTAVSSGVQQNDVRSLGQDIRYISTGPARLSEKGAFFVGSPLFVVICLAVLLVSALCWFMFRRMAARRADVAGNRNRKATKKALKQLRTASTFLKQNLYTAFYEELHKALLGFISDKLNIPMSELNRENISARLTEGGVPEDTVTAFVGLIDDCEFARYSPSAGNEAMQSHYDKAAELISTIDSSMKSGKRTPSGAALLAALLMLAPFAANAQQVPAGDDAPAAVAEQPAEVSAEQSPASSVDYPQQLWDRANAAYADGRWDDAADAYALIVSLGLESPRLYYNLGNAYFKAGSLGKAIVNYERAARLDPSDPDIRYNLEFASSRTQDRIDAVPEFILKTWTRRLCYILDSDAWAIIFIVLLVLTCAAVLVFLLAPTVGGRRTGFILALVFLLSGAAALGFSLHQKNDCFLHDEAVVMKPVISAKSSPEGSMDLFILHEGTKVKIVDSVGEWMNVEISDGRQGWTRSGDLEII